MRGTILCATCQQWLAEKKSRVRKEIALSFLPEVDLPEILLLFLRCKGSRRGRLAINVFNPFNIASKASLGLLD